MAEHMRVRPGDLHACGIGQADCRDWGVV